jgi:predicted DCC family thiol-disulfide oxidoreductase YuxK
LSFYLIYDSRCSYCRLFKAFVAALDPKGHLTFLSLTDLESRNLLQSMDEMKAKASFHLVDEEGKIKSGGKALPILLGLTTGIKIPSRLMDTSLMRIASAVIYGKLARLKERNCSTHAAPPFRKNDEVRSARTLCRTDHDAHKLQPLLQVVDSWMLRI